MTYDDWKTSTPDCDEEPCWRCKSAQKDVGNYCGDCAKGETMNTDPTPPVLDVETLNRLECLSKCLGQFPEGHTVFCNCRPCRDASGVEMTNMLAGYGPALIAAARELAELKARENLAAEKAWDEGYNACVYDPIHGPKSTNPYRMKPPEGRKL